MAKVTFEKGTLVAQMYKDVIVYGEGFQITATQRVENGKIVLFTGSVEKTVDEKLTRIGQVNYVQPYEREDGMPSTTASSSVHIYNEAYTSLQKDVYDIMYRYISQEDAATVTVSE